MTVAGREMTMTTEERIKEIKEAVDALFADTTVEAQTTMDALGEIQEYIIRSRNALREDGCTG